MLGLFCVRVVACLFFFEKGGEKIDKLCGEEE